MNDCSTCKHRQWSSAINDYKCTSERAGDQRNFRIVWVYGQGGACGPERKLYERKEYV